MMRSKAVELTLVVLFSGFFLGCPPFFWDGMGSSDWEEPAALPDEWPPDPIPETAQCGGPSEDRVAPFTRSISYDVDIQGPYVSAVMDIKVCGSAPGPDEQVLRFALPRGAVIFDAEVFLAAQNRWERAETVGRRQGEMVYEDVITPVERFIDPLLIQQIGLDLYRARVYPVDAWVGGRFRIHYAHLLEAGPEGSYRLQIALEDPDALPFDPAMGLRASVTADEGFWLEGRWTIDDSHARFDPATGLGRADVLEEEITEDLFLDLTPAAPMASSGMLQYQSDGQELAHTFVYWTPQLEDRPDLAPQPRNVVFVVDVSGSMSGTKLEETQKALGHALDDLDEGDLFGVVAFSDETFAFQQILSPQSEVRAARHWVEDLVAGGSTALAAGLRDGVLLALASEIEGGRLDIVLITDGLPTSGPSTPSGVLAALGSAAERAGVAVRIAACGIGRDLDQSFLTDLVQPTQGEATFALDDSEITGQILDLFSRVRSGGLSEVTISLEAYDEHYGPVRYFPGTPVHMGALAPVGDAPVVSLAGLSPSMAIIELSHTVDLGSAAGDHMALRASPLVAKAWSDRLERRIDTEGETSQLVDEAVQLARRHGIVTRYTAMLALESPQMYSDYGIDRPSRDEAGYTSESLTRSGVDESRIGGQGAMSYASADPGAGCTCRAQGLDAPNGGIVTLAALAMLWMRRLSRCRKRD